MNNLKRFTGMFIILASLSMLSCNRQAVYLPSWLEGTWVTEDTLGLVAESWEVINNEYMSGEGLFVNRERQTVIEVLNIFIQDNALVYTAMLPNQNNGEEIVFVDRKNYPDSLIFENPAHDYPKKIIYHKIDRNRVDVYIQGSKVDKPNTIRLRRADP